MSSESIWQFKVNKQLRRSNLTNQDTGQKARVDIMATKKELQKQKQKLSYKIRNIRDDYSGVLKEDIPEEVAQEIALLMKEMAEIRQYLEDA